VALSPDPATQPYRDLIMSPAHNSLLFWRVLIISAALTVLSGCGVFGGGDAPTFEEAFPATAVPPTTMPEPTAVLPTEIPDAPTATPEPPAPTPTPPWQPVSISNGIGFELPSSWEIIDDQSVVDEMMTSEETQAALAAAGVSGPMDLFAIEVLAIANGPVNEQRMFYVTIARSPVPALGLVSSIVIPIVENFDIVVNSDQEIATPVGNALRVEAELEGTSYLSWVWINNGEARVIILTTLDGDIERQLITTLNTN